MKIRVRHVPVLMSVLLLLMLALAACGGAPEEPEAMPVDSDEGMAMEESKEAPALAAMVAAGELPPLDERLPKNPMVVPVTESIGQYGGTWRSGLLGQADSPWVTRTMAYEPTRRWKPKPGPAKLFPCGGQTSTLSRAERLPICLRN